MMSLRAFLKSFTHAFRGISEVFQAEQSFRLQVGASIVVGIFAVLFSLTSAERILLFLLCMAVLVLEMINSTLERIADAVHPRLHPTIRDIKDMMAGAVLLSALAAFCVGCAIFLPHFVATGCAVLGGDFFSTACAW